MAERDDILKRVLDVDPKLIDDRHRMLDTLRGIRNNLYIIEWSAHEIIKAHQGGTRRGGIPITDEQGRVITSGEMVSHARDTLSTVKELFHVLGPPMFDNKEDLKDYIKDRGRPERLLFLDPTSRRWRMFNYGAINN